jgi:hypothetical protein
MQEFYEVWSQGGKFIGVAKTLDRAVEVGRSFKEGDFHINFKIVDSEGKSALRSDLNQ